MMDVVNIFKELEKLGLKPNVVPYSIFVQGYGTLKQFNKVTNVFNCM
jgi:hypothetical protein